MIDDNTPISKPSGTLQKISSAFLELFWLDHSLRLITKKSDDVLRVISDLRERDSEKMKRDIVLVSYYCKYFEILLNNGNNPYSAIYTLLSQYSKEYYLLNPWAEFSFFFSNEKKNNFTKLVSKTSSLIGSKPFVNRDELESFFQQLVNYASKQDIDLCELNENDDFSKIIMICNVHLNIHISKFVPEIDWSSYLNECL